MKKNGVGSLKSIPLSIAVMALLIMLATGIGILFRYIHFDQTNIVIVYLVSVVLTARFTQGYVYGILCSVIATLTFNFVFTEPYYTLSVNDPAYFVTFAVMTITAIITGALTSEAKQSALNAMEKEAETSALYHLTNQLTEAGNMNLIADIASKAIGDALRCKANVICLDENTRETNPYRQQEEGGTLVWSGATEASGISVSAAPDSGGWFLEWPIQGRETALGVVRIPAGTGLNESQTRLLRSMMESTALAMDRLCSSMARIRSAEEAEKERYRGNLLRAISHDLRTPLSGIMGTAEMLKDMTREDDPRRALAEDIFRESNWLHAMVENILSLTRLRDGAMPPVRQMEALEEVVGGAVNRVMRQSGRTIDVQVPNEVLFAPMDARLMEQVLANLLDNAVKHTQPQDEIKVTVQRDDAARQAVIRVSDRGAGIREEDLPHIFQMFYTTPGQQPDASRGVGLGLTICEAIVKAHNGAIRAENRSDGPGAVFTFTLPLEDEPHAKQIGAPAGGGR